MFSNYNEVLAQCKIVRNKQGEIIDPLHTTIPFLTKYEKARILGTRALQISMNAPIMVDRGNLTSAIAIAEKELQECKIPFTICRYLPSGEITEWKIEKNGKLIQISIE